MILGCLGLHNIAIIKLLLPCSLNNMLNFTMMKSTPFNLFMYSPQSILNIKNITIPPTLIGLITQPLPKINTDSLINNIM
jgi:hypothetical protein